MQKVLIAEDEKDIRDLVGFTLKLAGFDAVFASNGSEAITQALVRAAGYHPDGSAHAGHGR